MPGPFYFAWADFGEEFGEEHLLFELRIIAFTLSQQENEVAVLDIVAINPRIGLLNPGRKKYCFFAWDDGIEITPLFYGRIVGIPASIAQNKVQLQFRAEPDGFKDIKAEFAETLRVLPYYDPLWVDSSNAEDPDFALIARTVHYHVDRVTHELTISDDFSGEDGLLNFLETDVIRNSVDLQIGTPAVSEITTTAEVRWNQKATGTVDLSDGLYKSFKAAGSQEPFSISMYMPDVVIDNWPLPGDSIGGGWTVEDSVVKEGQNSWITPDQYANNLRTIFVKDSQSQYNQLLEAVIGAVPSIGLVSDTTAYDFPLGVYKATLVARYDAERERREILVFTMHCDIQELVTDTGGADIKQLTLASNDAGEPIDEGDALPIVDLRRRLYFATDRGRQSAEHLILRTRAELLDSARAVNVSFATRFENILDVSLRKSASLLDPRLPGGTAQGKIVAYSASLDGNAGRATCSITIGCSVGKGNTVSGDDGNPNYVEEGYVDTGYQTYSDKLILVAGDVTYGDYDNVNIDDDGIDFFNVREQDMLLSALVTNGVDVQDAAFSLNRFAETDGDVRKAVSNIQTSVCMNLKPVNGGPFLTIYSLTLSDLMAPRGIDLEAASS